jgi:nuclear transport factor 2 (NTF2) superfamily protein
MTEQRPPLPPFSEETAITKVRLAEDAWNSRDPARVALAYTPDSLWRNRDTFLQGRPAIVAFLTAKWQREQDYRLIKELWAFRENRIAVRFAYEWRDQAAMVPVLWERELGVRRTWADAAAHRQHQRRADCRSRQALPLAARTAARRL